MTKAEKIAELQEFRAAAKKALLAAYNALSYSIGNRSKMMADISKLKADIEDYDRQISSLEDSGSINVSYAVPMDI